MQLDRRDGAGAQWPSNHLLIP
eukprot:SAG31_NODE_38287_length_297_cov_1.005051_2_plen_21_part_01